MQTQTLLVAIVCLLAAGLATLVWIARRLYRRRRNTEYLEHLEQLARQDELATLGMLAASVGHEIRNVISVIKMRLYLARQQSDEVVADEIEGAVESITRLEELSEHLSTFTDDEEETSPKFGLQEAVEGAIETVEPKMNGEVEMQVDVAEELELEGCRGTFNQVLVNLVLNAYDAVRGVDEPRIVVRAEEFDEGAVRVVVCDNGPGLDEEGLDRIFEPFYTTKGDDREGGSGVGLWLCRQLLREQGGTIRAENRADGGARFVVEFPARPLEEPETDSEADDEIESVQEQRAEESDVEGGEAPEVRAG
jgi:signal transduction histidine kinase